MTESQLVTAICEYLELKRYFFWRQNNTAIYDKGKMVFRRMPKYCKKGVPDIIIVSGGEFIGLEVKMPKKLLSKDQRKFKDDLEFIGGTKKYYKVTSIEDVQKLGL